MSIAFTCLHCGKLYRVDAALAGRSGRCKACGRPMTIPTYIDDGDDTIATEGYDLSEPLPIAAESEAPSVFVPAGLDADVPRRPRRRASTTPLRKERPRRDEPDDPFHVRHRRGLIATPIVFFVGLGLTALLAPNGTLIAACILAGLGGLLILVGYGVGLWAAWREDSLYGFAYIVFPLYTAYYILTRFDDLWPWFAAMTVGAVLVALGGTIAESKLRDRPEPGAAWIERDPNGSPLHRLRPGGSDSFAVVAGSSCAGPRPSRVAAHT